MVTDFFLALLGYGGLYLCCFFLFLFCLRQESSTQGVQFGGVAAVRIVNGGFLGSFFNCFLRFLEPDLHNPVAFLKTRAPQPCFLSSSAPTVGSTGHADRGSSARDLHVLESPLLFGACERPRSSIFWPCMVGMGSTVVALRLGGTGDGACPPRAAVSGGGCFFLLATFFFGFFCFVLCIPLISLVQSACVLLRFC
jgi:hypothetical protein